MSESCKKIDFRCIEEITEKLRETFPGIQSDSYGFCCRSDYDAFHDHINDDDYVCAQVFMGGINNDWIEEEERFDIGSRVYFWW